MKFSISFLIGLTVFCALIVNYVRLESQRRKVELEKIRVEDEAAEMLPPMMVESNMRKSRQTDLTDLLATIQTASNLEQELLGAFDEYAEASGKIQPQGNSISIRRVPTRVTENLQLGFNVFVPEACTAAISLSLINPTDQTPVAYPTPPNQDWPIELELPEGLSRFELVLNESEEVQFITPDAKASSTSEKTTELTCQLSATSHTLFDLPLGMHDFSVESSEVGLQLDFPSETKTKILTVSPAGYDFALQVLLTAGDVK